MKLLYFFYCILRTDKRRFFSLLFQSADHYKKKSFKIILDILFCIFKYETMPLDYFYYKFIEIQADERNKYTSRLLMYRFQKKFNKKKDREIFKNKNLFHVVFKPFISHKTWDISRTTILNNFLTWILETKPKKIVMKNPLGQAGQAVLFFNIDYTKDNPQLLGFSADQFILKKIRQGYTLAESYIKQHDTLMSLFPGSLNTIRITTFLHDKNYVEFLYAIIRIGFDKQVDNFDAGGISALIDLDTGIIIKNGISKNPFDRMNLQNHPVTNFSIFGLQIPYWKNVLEMVKSAAKIVPSVRTVGWDVVITNEGPSLLEGNDNWDKTHWECCEEKGRKEKILTLYNKS